MRKHFFGIAIFVIGLVLGPLIQLDFFSSLPGDIVDARLNNYFLENIYQCVTGKAISLIHLRFFYPFPFVSGFSDNLIGSAPVYLLGRFLSLAPEEAFQLWFIIAYFTNFLSALYAIRLLGQSREASAIGAILFTYGLPVVAQIGHAQLHYRFCIPLAITYFYKFLKCARWDMLLYASFWLVWQFYCSIYLGFFVVLYMGSMILFIKFANINISDSFKNKKINRNLIYGYYYSLVSLNDWHKSILFLVSSILLVFLLVLFYPYYEVTNLYNYSRSWVEVSAMLPHVSSYFIADHSLIWGLISEKINGVPIRWEQQLFVGLVPIIVILVTVSRNKGRIAFKRRGCWLLFSLAALLIITLDCYGYSLWRLVFSLPLFSAIRAVSRIILIFLFPVAIFLAISIDCLAKNYGNEKKYILPIIAFSLLCEVSAVKATTSLKSEWLSRLAAQEARVPMSLPDAPILFFAQKSSFFEQEELDAMLIAQKMNLPTLNGYSGSLPHHFRAAYGQDCSEYTRRIILYLDFIKQSDNTDLYKKLASHVELIGFIGCQENWKLKPPMTISRRALTHKEISRLSLSFAPKELWRPPGWLRVRIINKGDENISAISGIDQPLRLAWRLVGADGKPQGAWTDPRPDLPANRLLQGYRQDLAEDIAPGGYTDILVPIPDKIKDGYSLIEFTVVQEAVLWGFSLNKNTDIWGYEAGVDSLRSDILSQ